MDQTRLDLLKEMPIFGAVRDDTLSRLLALTRDVHVKKGDFFFREAEKGDSMFVLEEGEVAVAKEWKGEEYVIRNLQAGDSFGEMAFIDLFPRSASVKALEDSSAIELTRDSLYEVYKCDLEQFALIEMNIGREISRRLRDADERLFRAKVEAKSVDEYYSFHAL